MDIRKIITVATLLLAIGLKAEMTRADEANQCIRVTFSAPVQVPGQVLPAGTYWFVLIDDRNPEIVQILSAERTKSYGILNTIARERSLASSNTAFTLAKRGSNEPEALVAWFYSGHNIGHELVYEKQIQKELSRAEKDTQISGN